MGSYEAIGVVEVQYYTTALAVIDEMCKASRVELLNTEKYLGGKLVTVIVGGSVSSVNAALEAAQAVGSDKENRPICINLMITKPHEEIMKFIVPKKQPKRRGKK